MKTKFLLYSLVALLTGQTFFSCQKPAYTGFSALPVEYKKVKPEPAVAPAPEVAAAPVAPALEPVLEASTAPPVPVLARPVAPARVVMPAPAAAPARVAVENPRPVAPAVAPQQITKAQKKEIRQAIRKNLKAGRAEVNLVEVLFAIIIPPVGVLLHSGLGTKFWISVILTLLFFLPGMIYALLVVTDNV